jgi:hypothetical protein
MAEERILLETKVFLPHEKLGNLFLTVYVVLQKSIFFLQSELSVSSCRHFIYMHGKLFAQTNEKKMKNKNLDRGKSHIAISLSQLPLSLAFFFGNFLLHVSENVGGGANVKAEKPQKSGKAAR